MLPQELVDEVDGKNGAEEKQENIKEENDGYGEVGQENDSEPPLTSRPALVFWLKTLLSTFIDQVYRLLIMFPAYILGRVNPRYFFFPFSLTSNFNLCSLCPDSLKYPLLATEVWEHSILRRGMWTSQSLLGKNNECRRQTCADKILIALSLIYLANYSAVSCASFFNNQLFVACQGLPHRKKRRRMQRVLFTRKCIKARFIGGWTGWRVFI